LIQCKRVFGLRRNGKIDGGDRTEGMAMGTKQGEGVFFFFFFFELLFIVLNVSYQTKLYATNYPILCVYLTAVMS